MFKMSGRLAIFRDHRPPVVEDFDFVPSEIDHRFYCQSHSCSQFWAGPSAPEVWNLRIFVHRSSDPMSNKLPNDGKVARFHITLDRMRNIAYPPTFPRYVERSEEHTSELQSRGHLVCLLRLYCVP